MIKVTKINLRYILRIQIHNSFKCQSSSCQCASVFRHYFKFPDRLYLSKSSECLLEILDCPRNATIFIVNIFGVRELIQYYIEYVVINGTYDQKQIRQQPVFLELEKLLKMSQQSLMAEAENLFIYLTLKNGPDNGYMTHLLTFIHTIYQLHFLK